jgi:hypothetical protein
MEESEKPCLRTLVEQIGASNQNITADALHLSSFVALLNASL